MYLFTDSLCSFKCTRAYHVRLFNFDCVYTRLVSVAVCVCCTHSEYVCDDFSVCRAFVWVNCVRLCLNVWWNSDVVFWFLLTNQRWPCYCCCCCCWWRWCYFVAFFPYMFLRILSVSRSNVWFAKLIYFSCWKYWGDNFRLNFVDVSI